MNPLLLIMLLLSVGISITAVVLSIKHYKATRALLASVIFNGQQATSDLKELADSITNFNRTLEGSLRTLDAHVDENAIMLRTSVEEVAASHKETQEGIIAILEVLATASGEPTAPSTPKGQCQETDCHEPGTVTATIKVKGQQRLKDVLLCEDHGKALVKQAFQIPGAAGSFEGFGKDGQPFKETFDNNICEHGFNHVGDPDWVPGQIHAHVEVETREEFLAKEGIDPDAEPDDTVLHPVPLDPFTAAVEEEFRRSKAAGKGA